MATAPTIGFRIDSTRFEVKIKRMLKRIGKSTKDFTSDQGILYALDLARGTPPHANGVLNLRKKPVGVPADKKTGEAAVRTDFKRAVRTFGPPSYWEDARIKRAISRRNYAFLEGFARNVDSLNKGLRVEQYKDSLHRRKRNRWGRVSKNEKGVIALSHSEVNAGLKKLLKGVGTAKAGFVECAKILGYRGRVPSWVARNLSNTNSSANLRRNARGWRAVFRSVAYGNHHVLRIAGSLARSRREKAVFALEKLVKLSFKKSGFKTK